MGADRVQQGRGALLVPEGRHAVGEAGVGALGHGFPAHRTARQRAEEGGEAAALGAQRGQAEPHRREGGTAGAQ
ncbi:hypothetical protein SCANM63S_08148 [Streptomyces canarius]